MQKYIKDIDVEDLLDFMIDKVTHPTFRGKACSGALNRRTTKALWGYITN